MKPFRFFVLVLITVLALAGLSNVPLVQDLVTQSGYSSTEVWSGIASVLAIIYCAIFALTVR